MKKLVNTDCYLGMEGWFIPVFECPKCAHKNPVKKNTKFCGGCGIEVKFSTSLQYLLKHNP